MKDRYFIVFDWMVRELTGLKLAVYAVVYGYSRDASGTYFGGNAELAALTGYSERNVRKALADLVEEGWLCKSEGFHQGTRTFDYYAVTPEARGIIHPGGQNARGIFHPEEGGVSSAEGGRFIRRPIDTTFKDTVVSSDNKDYKKVTRKGADAPVPVYAREDLPYSGEEFLELWNELLAMPKWRKKSRRALDMAAKLLGEATEDDACRMMRNAIAGEWQGLHLLERRERQAVKDAQAEKENAAFQERMRGYRAEDERRAAQ